MTNLKRATIASIVILVLIMGVAITSFAITSGTANKDAKLRKTTSNDSIVLEIIPQKDQVEILEEDGDWYKVNYKKIKGYVQKEFIDVIEESSQIDEAEDKKVEETQENQVDLKKGDTTLAKTEMKLYMRPLINSKTITKIQKDKQIVILEIRNNWCYVNVDNTIGWVRLDSLKAKEQDNKTTTESDNKENNDTKKETTTTLNKTGYITSTGINFREEPNTDSKVLKVFSQNAKVTILEEQGTWYKIKHNDKEGYVLKEYVSSKKVEVTSRSAAQRTTTTENKTTTQNTVEEKTTTKTSSKGQDAANYVKQFVGCKYVYGGSTPSGFDCSGLTMYVYKKYGINLSHSATAQSKVGTKVERANLQPGDLVFFKNYRTNTGIGHVGIYIGNNQFVHASTEKTGVITSSLTGSYSTRFVTARRIF